VREALGIPNPVGNRWSPEEDTLVRALLPPAAAARTGRSIKAVYARRRALGLPDGRVNSGLAAAFLRPALSALRAGAEGEPAPLRRLAARALLNRCLDEHVVNSASGCEAVDTAIAFSNLEQLLRSKAPERVEGRGTGDGGGRR
jgi:hypothetical protein